MFVCLSDILLGFPKSANFGRQNQSMMILMSTIIRSTKIHQNQDQPTSIKVNHLRSTNKDQPMYTKIYQDRQRATKVNPDKLKQREIN